MSGAPVFIIVFALFQRLIGAAEFKEGVGVLSTNHRVNLVTRLTINQPDGFGVVQFLECDFVKSVRCDVLKQLSVVFFNHRDRGARKLRRGVDIKSLYTQVGDC